MKIIKLAIALILISSCAYCADIDVVEVQPDIAKAREGDLHIYFAGDKNVEVVIRKGYVDSGDFVSVKETSLLWMDREDNPLTLENETSTEATDFINGALNKVFIRTAVLKKL